MSSCCYHFASGTFGRKPPPHFLGTKEAPPAAMGFTDTRQAPQQSCLSQGQEWPSAQCLAVFPCPGTGQPVPEATSCQALGWLAQPLLVCLGAPVFKTRLVIIAIATLY